MDSLVSRETGRGMGGLQGGEDDGGGMLAEAEDDDEHEGTA